MFNCSKCGACCRLAGAIVESLEVDFPYDFKDDGTCEKYDETIGCTVYNERPDICRTKDHIGTGLSEEDYDKRRASACNTMMKILEIDESFKLPE
jgi:Fe-S-cluster containining protein